MCFLHDQLHISREPLNVYKLQTWYVENYEQDLFRYVVLFVYFVPFQDGGHFYILNCNVSKTINKKKSLRKQSRTILFPKQMVSSLLYSVQNI
jgi:hypothetical protein